MIAPTKPDRRLRATCLLGVAALAVSCSPPGDDDVGGGVIHLAEHLAPPDARSIEPSVPVPSIRWTLRADVQGWSASGSGLEPLATGGLGVQSLDGRVLAASPPVDLPLPDLHSIQLRVRSSSDARIGLYWDDADGDFPSRFARPDWDPSSDPVYAVRGVRLSGSARLRDFRILSRDLWREGPEFEATRVTRIYVVAFGEGAVELEIESVGIVRRADVDPGPPRALVRETRVGVGMHAVALAGGVESSATVRLPESARLCFSLAAAGESAPAALDVTVRRDGREETVHRAEHRVGDRAWRPIRVDLSGYGGREVEITFRVTAPEERRLLIGAPIVTGSWSGHSLLLHTVDTLRADLLEPYGCPGRTSPVLSRLAREGTVFEECISTSTWTRPATASLLTSRSAPSHGVIRETSKLPRDVVTWSEVLRRHGYYTVAFFTNANAGRPSALDRGFDLVFETGRSPAGASPSSPAGGVLSPPTAGVTSSPGAPCSRWPWAGTFAAGRTITGRLAPGPAALPRTGTIPGGRPFLSLVSLLLRGLFRTLPGTAGRR